MPRQIVRPSVCPSVTLAYDDPIDWNSSKVTSRLISLGFSVSADSNIMGVFQREHHGILARIGVGHEKSGS